MKGDIKNLTVNFTSKESNRLYHYNCNYEWYLLRVKQFQAMLTKQDLGTCIS